MQLCKVDCPFQHIEFLGLQVYRKLTWDKFLSVNSVISIHFIDLSKFLARCVFPQSASSCSNGIKLCPDFVSLYSTLGGSSLNSLRSINPNSSNSLNSPESTLFEIAGMSCLSLPNRMVRSPIQFSMIGFHFPPIMDMVRVTGH